jgi:thioredoxin-like negative regulator of GroEL
MKTLAAFVIAFAVAAPASAAWRRVDSTNFIIVGDVSLRDLRATAEKFEAFREVLRRVMPAVTSSPPVPTIVVVFPSDEAFTPFKPTYQGKPKGVAGYAMPGADLSYIAMVNAVDSDRVIFHEYTHMVIANAVARIPVWLNEGLAEFYSTFALMDGGKRAQIGLPIENHLRLLNGSVRVSLVELLKADQASALYNEDSRVGDFYAESWALTHMLLMGQPRRVNELSTYLQQVNSGVDEKQAWEQVLGTSRTENDFRRYVTRPTVMTGVIEFPEKISAVPITEVPLSPAGATSFQAGLLARLSPDAGARLLEPVVARDPGDALAAATMAQIDLARHESAAAAKRVMSLGPSNDWYAAYSAGTTLMRLVTLEPLTDEQSRVRARASALLEQVRRDHAELPNVLASLARIELLGDTPPSSTAEQEIARARALAPGRVDYALTQAELYATRHDFARARAVVGPLMTAVYPEEVRSAARRLMGALVDLEAQLNGSPRPATASASASASAAARSRSIEVPDANADRPPASGPQKFRPAFRELQTGEERLDGTLERIDCAPGKPAALVVRTSAGLVELEAQISGVQFISFRDDLTGGVTCGPRAPMRVYVTWREGTSPRHEKIVVAVEFLPKD